LPYPEAIAAEIDYFVWYITLRGLSVTQTGGVQLFVLVIAATGVVVLTSELITFRLIESSVLILGGIETLICFSQLSYFTAG
tara:strand:+ start:8956 stop:9201 length:246 start_codon:yes stop_codon:yes gene_type:complete